MVRDVVPGPRVESGQVTVATPYRLGDSSASAPFCGPHLQNPPALVPAAWGGSQHQVKPGHRPGSGPRRPALDRRSAPRVAPVLRALSRPDQLPTRGVKALGWTEVPTCGLRPTRVPPVSRAGVRPTPGEAALGWDRYDTRPAEERRWDRTERPAEPWRSGFWVCESGHLAPLTRRPISVSRSWSPPPIARKRGQRSRPPKPPPGTAPPPPTRARDLPPAAPA